MDPAQNDFQKQLAERFKTLPKVVQDAIMSADVQKRLRELATTHKLHVDEWGTLENEVMLTLLGFQQPEDLGKNLQSELGVAQEEAYSLAQGINTIVFEPIRHELERQLEHPEAQAVVQTDVEATREQILGTAGNAPAPTPPQTPAVAPATPPTPKPETSVAKMPASGAYKPGEASTERKSIVDDPYREPPK